MKTILINRWLLLALLLISFVSGNAQMNSKQVEQIVAEAYTHCFPIVENYKAMYFYGVDKTSEKYSPMNSFTKTSRLYTPDDIFVVTPNNDTYYAISVLDLRAEPVIIKVPEANNRYYVIQLVDMLTNNFDYIGTNSTGSAAGIYAITGPDWKGTLPANVKQIKSISQFCMAIGRIGVNGESADDMKLAEKFQHEMEIGGMSKFYPQTKPIKVADINFPKWTSDVHTSTHFFELLNFLLSYIELPQKEKMIIEKYKAIGVESGKNYSFVADNPAFKDAVMNGMTIGLTRVDEFTRNMAEIHNGWICLPFIKLFDENYNIRTAVARIGIYALDPFEAHYPMSHTDINGSLLNGANEYTLTFPAGQLPPVKFFWSITMYDTNTQLLIHNPINRYSIGDRTKGVKYNEDGSLTIYFSHKEPKEGKTNWLPSPEGNFNLVMRLYGPKESVQNLSWIPLPIIKTNK